MIPDNAQSLRPVPGAFLYPDNLIPLTLTEDYELGGIAIQNPSQGLQYQVWTCSWDPITFDVTLSASLTGARVVILNEPNVRELSFSFDQNMRWVLGVTHTTGEFILYWYDAAAENYVQTRIDGIGTFKLSHDDKRAIPLELGMSDVILTYIQLNKLYVRNQRDRYQIAHLINPDIPANVVISQFGMSDRDRMQWRMRPRKPREQI